MRVLVTAASKHGSTMEIADRIGRTLQARGIDTDVLPAEQVASVAKYDAVLLGSAVYAGHWLAAGRDLVERETSALSSGPPGCSLAAPLETHRNPRKNPWMSTR